MKFHKKWTEEKIMAIAKDAIGKKVSQIANINFENKKNKGTIGQLIEKSLYGIKNNSSSQ